MAQADSRRSEIVEGRPVHVRSVVDNVLLEQDFFQVLPFSLVGIIPKIFYGHIHLHVLLNKGKEAKPWNPPKSITLSDIGEQYFHFKKIGFIYGSLPALEVV